MRLVNLTEIDTICDNEQLEVSCLASGCTIAHTTIKLTIPGKEKLLQDLERNLTSDPPRPPSAPLSTKEPCVA